MDIHRFFKSFKFAFKGVIEALKKEQNLKIFLVVAVGVIILSWILKITRIEWAIIVYVVSFCLAIETINTALEQLLDMISPEHNGKAKIIKDIVAGAVLFSSIGALIIAFIIFIPNIIK